MEQLKQANLNSSSMVRKPPALKRTWAGPT
ncbi:rCG52600 [Rattus norvegicus]|uniref:RCG52600 n=1 Tax=Rattus norvegicus TaxID=10116 RepID=A6IR51_RAT|nr:rCG52600 [Rattus norvegicus]